jgi:hypothetical protein
MSAADSCDCDQKTLRPLQSKLGQQYSSPGVSSTTFSTQPLEFTIPALDGYGLRYLTLTRPAFSPDIQFLFVGSYL